MSTEPLTASVSEETGEAHHGSLKQLALAALGVVYGDIGTSPLYAFKECFHGSHAVTPVEGNVLGVLSLMIWSVTLVVSVKYLGFVTRANNQGEGGGLAMLALLQSVLAKPKRIGGVGLIAGLIVFGACLLYGEGIITPAISVLSAVEGLTIATDKLSKVVIPLTVAILIGVFTVQKRGTAMIGRVFGPVMIVWFSTIAILGVIAITRYPSIFRAFDPRHAVHFFITNGFDGFALLGSVVLCITGGEALYADMGHFGRRPIKLAWYGAVMPALILNYLGQGALLLANPERAHELAKNPFYGLVSGHAIFPLVAISTAATVIASQALISGAYSLTRQAVQLGYLPRVAIRHTSHETEGQIYIPIVNNLLAVGCIGLVLGFGSSSALAGAYGISVMGTMAITSVAFFVVTTRRWGWKLSRAIPLLVLFLTVDLGFFAANLLKFFDGGYVPVVIAISLFLTMLVWKRGRALLAQHFVRASKPLDAFLAGLCEGCLIDDAGKRHRLVRVPGIAVFLTSNPTGTPPLLLHHARHNKGIHERVFLVTVDNVHTPRVRTDRIEIETLEGGFSRVKIRVGFMETPDVPRALEEARRRHGLPFDATDVTYYLGRETLIATRRGHMGARAEKLFSFLSRNSQQAMGFFGIPPERVVEIGMQVDL